MMMIKQLSSIFFFLYAAFYILLFNCNSHQLNSANMFHLQIEHLITRNEAFLSEFHHKAVVAK